MHLLFVLRNQSLLGGESKLSWLTLILVLSYNLSFLFVPANSINFRIMNEAWREGQSACFGKASSPKVTAVDATLGYDDSEGIQTSSEIIHAPKKCESRGKYLQVSEFLKTGLSKLRYSFSKSLRFVNRHTSWIARDTPATEKFGRVIRLSIDQKIDIKRMQIALNDLVSSTQQLKAQLKAKLEEKLEASLHGKTKNQLENARKLAKTIKLLISHATYKLYQVGLEDCVPLEKLLAPHVPADLSEKIMQIHSMNLIAELKSSLQYPSQAVVDENEIEFQTIVFRALRCIIRFGIVPSDLIDDPFDGRFPCIIGHHLANRIRMTQETYPDFETIVRKPIAEVLLKKNLFYVSEESSGYHDLQNLITCLSHEHKGKVLWAFIEATIQASSLDIIKESGLIRRFLTSESGIDSHQIFSDEQKIREEVVILRKSAEYLIEPLDDTESEWEEKELEYLWVYHLLKYKMDYSSVEKKALICKGMLPSSDKKIEFIHTALMTFMTAKIMHEMIIHLKNLHRCRSPERLGNDVVEALTSYGITPQAVSNIPLFEKNIVDKMAEIASITHHLRGQRRELSHWMAENPVIGMIYNRAIDWAEYACRSHARYSPIYEASLGIAREFFKLGVETNNPDRGFEV